MRSRSIAVAIWIASLALGSAGCDRRSNETGDPEQRAEANATARGFVVDARGVAYWYRDERRGRQRVEKLEDVPISKRAAVIIEHQRWPREQGESLKDAREDLWVANLAAARPGDKVKAHRQKLLYIRAASLAGEWAQLHGKVVALSADRMVMSHEDSDRGQQAARSKELLEGVLARSAHLEREGIEKLKLACETEKVGVQGEAIGVEGNGDVATHLRMQSMAMYHPVVMYCIEDCAGCDEARQGMAKLGVPFREVIVRQLPRKIELVRAQREAGLAPGRLPFFRIGAATMQGWAQQRFEKLVRRESP